MTIIEILESVQYVVDSQGRKTAVQFDLSAWEQLRPLMEELIEDGRLGQLMEEVADDERFNEAKALEAYKTFLAEV
jgi:hypothetical protein